MSHHIGLQILRAKVRGFHVTGTTLQSRISKAKGAKKSKLWELKHRLGNQARYHLVAYGLLRGVPYDRIERCDPNNKLNPEKLLEIMVAHTGIVEMTCQHTGRKLLGWAHYDLEKVRGLITPVIAIASSATTSGHGSPSTPDRSTVPSAAAAPAAASKPSSRPTGLLQRAHELLRKMA